MNSLDLTKMLYHPTKALVHILRRSELYNKPPHRNDDQLFHQTNRHRLTSTAQAKSMQSSSLVKKSKLTCKSTYIHTYIYICMYVLKYIQKCIKVHLYVCIAMSVVLLPSKPLSYTLIV